MSKSVKNKLVSGVIWSGASRYISLAIQFIITIILARILSPSDYGAIGLLSVFSSISLLIVDSGFGLALIQKGNPTNEDYSSVFYFNIGLGILSYLILFFASPYIALFYNIPELEIYAKIIFLVIPINSIGIIQSVILRKDMEFNKLSVIEIISAFLSGVVGLLLAYNNFGIYSLIAQNLSITVFRVIFLLLYKRWIPMLAFSYSSIKRLFAFGCNLLSMNLMTVLFNNIFTLIIGKTGSSSEVGNYTQAQKFEEISADTLTYIIIGVSFPALVNYKDDIDKLRNAYRMIIKANIMLVAPLMLCLFFVSNELFTVLLTDKWSGAVPYFQILCIYGMTFPLHQLNSNIYKVLGKSKLLLHVEMFRRVLLIISILFTINYGVKAMLIGQIFTMLIVVAVNMIYSGKLINYSVKDQIRDVIPYYWMSFLIIIPITYLVNILSLGIYWGLFLKLGLSGIGYILLCYFRNDSTFVALQNIILAKTMKKQPKSCI